MNKQKFLKLFLVLIGLLIIVFSGVFVINSLNYLDNLNWKTYRNEEFGFEFKYPQNWQVGNVPIPPKTNIYFVNYPDRGFVMSEEDLHEGEIYLSLNIFLNNDHLEPRNWLSKEKNRYNNKDCREIKINNDPFLECRKNTYLFFDKNLVYGFQILAASDQELMQAQKITLNIIQTLKTAKDDYQPIINKSNWKTYDNKKFHYKVQYPAYWIEPLDFTSPTRAENDLETIMLRSTQVTDWININVFVSKELEENKSSNDSQSKSEKPIIVNGIQGEEEIDFDNEQNEEYLSREFNYQDKTYNISTEFSKFDANQEERKEVIRSFEIY